MARLTEFDRLQAEHEEDRRVARQEAQDRLDAFKRERDG